MNAVAIRGFTEHDVVPLARYCREHGFELRFIEYMPIGAEAWERDKVFFAARDPRAGRAARSARSSRPIPTRRPRRQDYHLLATAAAGSA